MMKPSPSRFPGKVKALLLAGILFLLGTVMVLMLSIAQRASDWRTGTRRVASVNGWYPTLEDPFHHWLSETELLYIEATVNSRCILKKRNVVTGTTTNVMTLPIVFRANQARMIRLSPDGNYLLWRYRHPNGVQTTGMVDLYGTGKPRLVKTNGQPWEPEEPIYWLPDSSGWFDREEKVYPTATGKPQKAIRFLVPPIKQFPYCVLIGPVAGGDWIGFHPSFTNPSSPDPEIARMIAPFTRKSSVPATTRSPITRSEASIHLHPLSLSPDGGRILWIEKRARSPWQYKLWNWFLGQRFLISPYLLDSRWQTVLYTTDLTASQERLIISLPEQVLTRYPPNIQWTPNRIAISFVCEGELYVRSVR